MKTPLVITPKKTQTDDNDNNWSGFTISIFVTFIIVLLYILIGSNFIYLLNNISKGNSDDLIERLRPFSNSRSTHSIAAWFFDTVDTSYKTNITALVKILSALGIMSKDRTNIQAILSGVPFAILLIVAMLIFASNWVYMFQAGAGWSLLGIFMAYSFLVNSFISVIQIFQYIYIFSLMPFITKHEEWKKNIEGMKTSIWILFGLLVCVSASGSLNSYISTTMAVMYAYFIIKQFI